MNAAQLLSLLDQLAAGTDPQRQIPFDLTTSCLAQPGVAAALTRFRGVVGASVATVQASLSDSVLLATYSELEQLGYQPTPEQLVRVLRGSRSIADASLKAVSHYGRYRNAMSKAFMRQTVAQFATRHPDLWDGEGKRATKQGVPAASHPTNPFFREHPFDKLTDDKAEELRKEIVRLGVSRPTDKLPGFKQRARQNYPRAYEPWSREERALLIEAMCYTNDAERIAKLFGRTAKSVMAAGLKLIAQSQDSERAA